VMAAREPVDALTLPAPRCADVKPTVVASAVAEPSQKVADAAESPYRTLHATATQSSEV